MLTLGSGHIGQAVGNDQLRVVNVISIGNNKPLSEKMEDGTDRDWCLILHLIDPVLGVECMLSKMIVNEPRLK